MLEAEATADMLLMTQPFTAPIATELPLEVVLVRAVLSGERDRFATEYKEPRLVALQKASGDSTYYMAVWYELRSRLS